MARTPLNKAELARKKRQLATYRRFLPSLDMKRKQLMAERQRARRQLREAESAVEEVNRRVAEQLPMLADAQVEVEGLVRVLDVRLATQNVVELDPDRARRFVAGEDQELDWDGDWGFLIGAHDLAGRREPIGVGLYVYGELRSQIPKGRRREF
jgi:hypothetical protein